MGQRTQRALGWVMLGLMGLLTLGPAPVGESAVVETLRFGMDVRAADALRGTGLEPDYATLWAGVWLEKRGWAGFNGALDRLRAADVTPAVHFYYWGNDISRACLENGCWSETHNAWKDRAGWQDLARALARSLNDRMGGRGVVVILETEFNKNGVSDYEPLDAYLAEKAQFFHEEYPAARVVLGFGNWASGSWATFDRAAARSDLVGVQAMRASTRDSVPSYEGVGQSVLDAAEKMVGLFGKRVLVTDLALGSYPEPGWLVHQRDAVRAVMGLRDELRQAGVVGILYRGLHDAPNADPTDWYGQAERHFGLVWKANGSWKPAMAAWAQGVQAERALAPQAAVAETASDAEDIRTPAQLGSGAMLWWRTRRPRWKTRLAPGSLSSFGPS